jgi:hypothetical protein
MRLISGGSWRITSQRRFCARHKPDFLRAQGIDVTPQTAIAVAKDLVSIAAGVTAIVVAVKGLATWKRQLRGNADFDLAKRALHAVFGFRDAIRACRSPFMSGAEMEDALEAEDSGRPERVFASDKARHDAGQLTAYQRRWRRVADAQSKVHDLSLEAEALWGPQIPQMLVELAKSSAELHWAIEQYVSRREIRLESDEYARIRKIVFEADTTPPADFTKQLTATVDAIGRELAVHLKP